MLSIIRPKKPFCHSVAVIIVISICLGVLIAKSRVPRIITLSKDSLISVSETQNEAVLCLDSRGAVRSFDPQSSSLTIISERPAANSAAPVSSGLFITTEPGTESLVCGDVEGRVSLWNAQTNEWVERSDYHSSAVTVCLGICLGDECVLTKSKEALVLRDRNLAPIRQLFAESASNLPDILICGENQMMCLLPMSPTIEVRSLIDDHMVDQASHFQCCGVGMCMVVSSDQSQCFVGTFHGKVVCYQTSPLKLLWHSEACSRPIDAIYLSPNGHLLVVREMRFDSRAAELIVFRIHNTALAYAKKLRSSNDSRATCIAFASDDARIYVGRKDGTLEVWPLK